MDVLIVGTVAYDAIETPFGKESKVLGGAATYIALAASFLEVKSHIVSVIGEDFEQAHLDFLKGKSICLEGLEIVPGGKTFFWSGRYHDDMNVRDTLDTQLNVLENFNPKVPEHIKSPSILMLGNLHPLVQKQVLDQLTERPKLVVLDTMNFWMDCALEDLKAIITKTDVLTINEEEARQLSGEYSLVKAAKKIREMGPSFLIIKKGEHGALLFHEKEIFFAPALPLEEVFDPTGAGDAFAGGFIGYLAKTEDLSFENMKKAMIYGSALASFTVEKFGTERLKTLTKEQLINRLEVFCRLTAFDLAL